MLSVLHQAVRLPHPLAVTTSCSECAAVECTSREEPFHVCAVKTVELQSRNKASFLWLSDGKPL